jgi:hypothetical protein
MLEAKQITSSATLESSSIRVWKDDAFSGSSQFQTHGNCKIEGIT